MRSLKSIFMMIAPGLFLSVLVSLYIHEGAVQNFRFHLRLYNAAAEKASITDTIKLFNQYYAKFFSTGGDLDGLGVFPADNMVKRRVVQELRSWILDGKVLVYDKDYFKLDSIEIVAPSFAIAVASETWFLNIQDAATRIKEPGVKADAVKIRYTMKKENGNWKVKEYEVFGKNDVIAPYDLMRLKQ